MNPVIYLLATIGSIALLHQIATRVAKAARRAQLNSWDPFTKDDPYQNDH
jgi:hypothetical protein